MRIDLAYGRDGLVLDLDESSCAPTVILPKDLPELADPHAAFLRAVRCPVAGATLAELGRSKPARVAIAIADHTRPVPDHLLVPWIVAELGVPDSAVTILIGTGTHRASTAEELTRMLGEAASRFRIINHDCHDPTLVQVGHSRCGGEAWLNRAWVEADVRIATGFIEPHFYAGFSGGAKAVVPGIAGLRTVQHFHRASLIGHPRTTWGDPGRNPLQALTREMTALCPPHAIVNVTLNRAKRITAVYAGELVATHDAGCAAALHEAMVGVPQRYPLVVTTNSGYPLDQNFYQTVKGISAASRIVEPGGTIVVASACSAGIPDEGAFKTMLADPSSDRDLLNAIEATVETRHDQWQAQTLLQCLVQARVVLHSTLPAASRRFTRTEHSDDLSATIAAVRSAWSGSGRMPVAVMPLGPLTIPEVRPAPAANH